MRIMHHLGFGFLAVHCTHPTACGVLGLIHHNSSIRENHNSPPQHCIKLWFGYDKYKTQTHYLTWLTI